MVKALRWTVVSGLLATLLVARELFVAQGLLGPVAVAGDVQPPRWLLEIVWFLLVAGTLAYGFRPAPRLGYALCGLLALRCVWDRMTWQPYLLQSFVFLVALSWAGDGREVWRRRELLRTFRFVVVAIYVWSGFSKLHHAYVVEGTPTFRAVLAFLPSWLQSVAWPASAAGELVLGLLLLAPRYRRGAAILLAAMHVFILSVLVARGHNEVVWPWNLLMVTLLGLLFLRDRGFGWREVLVPTGVLPRWTAIALIGVAPGLSYLGWWSEYLSFRLYSQRYRESFVYVKEEVREQLPAGWRAFYTERPQAGFHGYFNALGWGEARLGAFPPADAAVHKALARRIMGTIESEDPIPAVLLLEDVPHWRTGVVKGTTYRREDL